MGRAPVILREALAANLRRDLLSAIERALERQGLTEVELWRDFVPNHSPAWIAIQQAVLGAPAMQASREHLAAAASEAIGERLAPRFADVVRVFAPGSDETTPAHQDAHYFGEDPPRFVAWVALTAAEQGGLELYVPQTPVDAVLPHTGLHDAGPYLEALPPGRWSRPILYPGDAVLFDVLTIHRGTSNGSERPRISVDVRLG